MTADDLPEWAVDPRTPAWARAPRYLSALNPIDVIEIQRCGVPKRTIDQRIAGRKRNAKRAQQRTEVRAAETPEQSAERERLRREAQRLSRRQSMVKFWENKIAKAEAHPPGSLAAMNAVFALPSMRARLAEAREELRQYVESALRAELARDE